MSTFRYFLIALTGLFILSSCGNTTENRSVEEYASAFIQNNSKVAIFGSIDAKTILEKADYSSIPKFGGIIESELKSIESGLNVSAGFYYAIEGPFDPKNMGTAYLFAEVKNRDSLLLQLTQRGYDLEKSGNVDYFQSGDVGVAIKGKLALLFVKSGEFNVKETAETALKFTEGNLLEGTAKALLAKRGDISLNMHQYNITQMAADQNKALKKEKKAELLSLQTGSFAQMNIFFENGQIRMAFKNEMSAAMEKRMMFKSDNQAPIRKFLGQGEPKAAFAMNMDMPKFQSWLDDFYPGTMETLMENAGPLNMALMMGGGKWSNIMDGKLGVAMFGEPTAGSITPHFTFYMGFGPNGKGLAEMGKNFLAGGTMIVDINDKGVKGASSEQFMAQAGKQISVPKVFDTFGKSAFSMFLNLENVDTKSFEFEGAAKLIELVKYVNFYLDTRSGEMIIKTKEDKPNVLKQAADKMVKEFESKIGEMSI